MKKTATVIFAGCVALTVMAWPVWAASPAPVDPHVSPSPELVDNGAGTVINGLHLAKGGGGNGGPGGIGGSGGGNGPGGNQGSAGSSANKGLQFQHRHREQSRIHESRQELSPSMILNQPRKSSRSQLRHGPGDGTGNQGQGPQDGTGFGAEPNR